MSFDLLVMLVYFALNNPADLLSIVFVAVLHMVLQPLDEEFFMLFGGN